MSDYLFDKTGAPGDNDGDVAELEGLLAAYAHRAPLREPPPREPPRRRRFIMAGAGAAVAVAAIALWLRTDRDACARGDGFAFAVEGGAARCNGGEVSRGTLPVGAWLETSGDAKADVRVANIGTLTVHGDSRIRLVGTGAAQHHMELARGRIEAHVTAPPRLFVVDTPGATAVDLGCAYELVVEPDGRTRLRVSGGAVSLEGAGRVAYAPLGTEVRAAPGRGPGTPVVVGAPAPLVAAVDRFDAGDAAALPALLDATEARDTITLWNLLSRTAAAERAGVVARLERLVGRPDNVSADEVIAGDAAAIERWREVLEDRWICPECIDDLPPPQHTP